MNKKNKLPKVHDIKNKMEKFTWFFVNESSNVYSDGCKNFIPRKTIERFVILI